MTEWIKGAELSVLTSQCSKSVNKNNAPWRKRRRGTNYNLQADVCVKI